MLKFESNEMGNLGVLTLSGQWPPARSQELKTLLLDALTNAGSVSIRFDGIDTVSLPFFQLLLSAKTTAEGHQRKITFAEPIPPLVTQAARQLGLAAILGTPTDGIDRSASKGTP